MPFTLTMPKLSPTMEAGTITQWHKSVGDYIEAGDLLIEVATDKATVEYTALDSGWLRQIVVASSGVAIVNQAIAILTEEKEESIEGYQPTGVALVQIAATSEKVVEQTIESIAAPTATNVMPQPIFAPEPPLENYQFQFPIEEQQKQLRASPLARRLANEQHLDLASIKGSGPGGRIMNGDLKQALPNTLSVFAHKNTEPNTIAGSYREESMTPMRKAIGKRLQESKSFIPHFYVTQTIDVDALMEIRNQLKNSDIKVTINDFIIRATALALRQHPQVNSGYNSAKQSIVYFETIDICVAVSVEGGLITPIIRHADYKNIGQISVEVKALAKQARENKLQPEQYKGGSFTISNLGMYGIKNFKAIINPPQSAILAIGGVQQIPVVREGKIEVGQVMELTLSVDHRVVDGAKAAEFLNTIKKYLENPAALLV